MLTVGLSTLLKTADPREAWNYQHFLLLQCIFQTLVRVDDSGKLVSDLAARWEVSPDGKIYRFYLNPNAKFHSGKQVTSTDVARSFGRHFWPKSPSVVKTYLSELIRGAASLGEGRVPVGIKALKPEVVEFELMRPYPPFLFVLAMPGFSITPDQSASPDNEWVGSGPMSARYDVKTNQWTLNNYESYSGTKAKTKSLTLRWVSDFPAYLEAFQAQELDVGIGLPVAELTPDLRLPGYRITKTNTLVYSHLFYNNRRKLFDNFSLRRDLAALLQGVGKIPHLLSDYITYEPYYLPRGVMPSSYYQRDQIDLSASQFKVKWGAVVSGQSLHLVLLKSFYRPQMIEQFVTVLAQVGFKVRLDAITAATYTEVLKKQDYDIITGSYVGNFPDPDGFLDPLRENSGVRFGAIPTRQLFLELDRYKHLQSADERLKKYATVMKSFEDQWYFIPMHRINIPIVHNEKISVPDTNFRYEAELWNIFWSK